MEEKTKDELYAENIINKEYLKTFVRHSAIVLVVIVSLFGIVNILDSNKSLKQDETGIYQTMSADSVNSSVYTESVNKITALETYKERNDILYKGFTVLFAGAIATILAGLILFAYTKIDFTKKISYGSNGKLSVEESKGFSNVISAIILGALILTGLIFSNYEAKSEKLKTSQVGINLIKSFEGFRSKAYLDIVKVPTIGYGHTATVKLGMVIDRQEGERLLRYDLVRFENHIHKKVKRQLKQNEFDALSSFCFNLGYRISGELQEAINISNHQKVYYKMNLYNRAGGQIVKGLVRRRDAESKMYLGNQDILFRYI